jgi:hypothetical protein
MTRPAAPARSAAPAGPYLTGPELPEFVFAPARPQLLGGRKDVVFEVRQLADGSPVLPVFTSVQRLVAALGEAQPWACLPLREVRALMGLSQVPQVLIDPGVDPGAWRWQQADLEAYASSLHRAARRDGEEGAG